MSRRVKRLTPTMLRRLVLEEKAKMLKESDPIDAGIDDVAKVVADEVEAGDEADTIAWVRVPALVEAHHIDQPSGPLHTRRTGVGVCMCRMCGTSSHVWSV